MSDDARRSLADQHRQLLDALSGRGPAPPGFDAVRVALAARTLLNKRMRSVARQWPALADVPGYAEQFAIYAGRTPLPTAGGSIADGRRFYEFLRHDGRLTNAARVESMVDRVNLVVIARLDRPQRWAVAIRLPWRSSQVWLFQI